MAFSANVNFQPSNTTVPGGYLPDYGNVYAARGGGQTYGWTTSNYNGVDRNSAASPDQRHDTFNFLQPSSGPKVWEIAVPSGSYSVKIVAGDPGFTGHTHKINAEGVLTVSGTTTSSARWVTGTQTVNVTDGRLTIAAAAGAAGTRINFVEVRELTVSPPPPPPTSAPGVTGVTLVNAATDQDVGPLADGTVIDQSVAGDQLTVRAGLTNAPSGSLKFVLDGGHTQVESAAPYSLFGDDPGPDYLPGPLPAGNHQLVITPYAGAGATGTAGAPYAINFTVVNQPPSPPPPTGSTTVSVRSTADAHGRNGSFAGVNFGMAGELEVRLS